MREIVHLQAGQCGNQIGAKVGNEQIFIFFIVILLRFRFFWEKLTLILAWFRTTLWGNFKLVIKCYV